LHYTVTLNKRRHQQINLDTFRMRYNISQGETVRSDLYNCRSTCVSNTDITEWSDAYRVTLHESGTIQNTPKSCFKYPFRIQDTRGEGAEDQNRGKDREPRSVAELRRDSQGVGRDHGGPA